MKKRAQTICALCWGCRFLPKREGGFLHIYCADFGGRKHHLFPTFVVSSFPLLCFYYGCPFCGIYPSIILILWLCPFYYGTLLRFFCVFYVCFSLFLVSTVTLSFYFCVLVRFFYVLYVLLCVLYRFFMFFVVCVPIFLFSIVCIPMFFCFMFEFVTLSPIFLFFVVWFSMFFEFCYSYFSF